MTKPSSLRILLALASFGTFAFTGCESSGNRVHDHGISAVQFADIPVPAGMRLETGGHESHSYEAGRWRYGDFKYSGGLSADETLRYMRERMAYHGWDLRETKEHGKVSELAFERFPYRTSCRIWRDEGLTRMTVEVRTDLGEAVAAPR